ncbi:MAG: hypothetical protein ACOVQ7_27705 [Limnoraphis robusta]
MKNPNFMQRLAINILEQAMKLFDDDRKQLPPKPFDIDINGDTITIYNALTGKLHTEKRDSEAYKNGYRWCVQRNEYTGDIRPGFIGANLDFCMINLNNLEKIKDLEARRKEFEV